MQLSPLHNLSGLNQKRATYGRSAIALCSLDFDSPEKRSMAQLKLLRSRTDTLGVSGDPTYHNVIEVRSFFCVASSGPEIGKFSLLSIISPHSGEDYRQGY